jgi:hypothetical protein
VGYGIQILGHLIWHPFQQKLCDFEGASGPLETSWEALRNKEHHINVTLSIGTFLLNTQKYFLLLNSFSLVKKLKIQINHSTHILGYTNSKLLCGMPQFANNFHFPLFLKKGRDKGG